MATAIGSNEMGSVPGSIPGCQPVGRATRAARAPGSPTTTAAARRGIGFVVVVTRALFAGDPRV